MKIEVSFKQTQRDTKLYLAVKEQEEQSVFVKDALEFYLEYLEKSEKNKPNPQG